MLRDENKQLVQFDNHKYNDFLTAYSKEHDVSKEDLKRKIHHRIQKQYSGIFSKKEEVVKDMAGLVLDLMSTYGVDPEEVDSVGFRSAISKGKTVCMFTAVWCGPCRLMYPRLENVAKQLGKGYRFIKVDIDHCRAIAQEYNCTTIPVIILFENGKELRRITSSAYGEEDIMKFVEGR